MQADTLLDSVNAAIQVVVMWKLRFIKDYNAIIFIILPFPFLLSLEKRKVNDPMQPRCQNATHPHDRGSTVAATGYCVAQQGVVPSPPQHHMTLFTHKHTYRAFREEI